MVCKGFFLAESFHKMSIKIKPAPTGLSAALTVRSSSRRRRTWCSMSDACIVTSHSPATCAAKPSATRATWYSTRPLTPQKDRSVAPHAATRLKPKGLWWSIRKKLATNNKMNVNRQACFSNHSIASSAERGSSIKAHWPNMSKSAISSPLLRRVLQLLGDEDKAMMHHNRWVGRGLG